MKTIIFDTDLGGDCDDVMALDLLLSAHKRNIINFVGVAYSADAMSGVPCIHCILNQHGYGNIPIGRAPIKEGTVTRSDVYASAVANAFANDDTPKYETTDCAVAFYRKLLNEYDNITLVVTGFLTNIAALFDSQPDEISPLSGRELVKQKVDEIAIMGCNFSHQNNINPVNEFVNEDGTVRAVTEWNIYCDIPAAQTVASTSPVKLVFCPFELGYKMLTGVEMTAKGGREHADSLSFIVHGSQNGRDSWDPATALYAVFGTDGIFDITEAGRVEIDDAGVANFYPDENGNSYYLKYIGTQKAIADRIDAEVALL